MILFWQYETYQENLASRARLLLAENPAEEVFQILKEDGDLNTEEVQDILGDYGYEHVRDSLEGQRFLRNCGWTAGGAVALYLGYAAVVFYEKHRHKKEMEEQSKRRQTGLRESGRVITGRILWTGMKRKKVKTGFWMSWILSETTWK